jgi:CheY-like chemotaxis protein
VVETEDVGQKAGHSPPRILLVEDGTPIVRLIHYLLRDQADVEAVACVHEALHRISQTAFDLFLIDIQLQGRRTGVDLLQEVRSQNNTTPAVALTAHALPGDRERLLDLGFDAYLAKPFSREDLETTIAQVLIPTARG